ncbi:hypothetical protein [uncultured Aquimarina sp.]|uniref:hypothetical protein n=1 Tax=uncultured Aquimarina sp. TaxID=575652 RepID=UPI00261D6B66|nr:hypothetical protein [uncultured Aquimarina sp.]
MKKVKVVKLVFVLSMCIFFISCSNEDEDHNEAYQQSSELIDVNFEKDLDNFDYVIYLNQTYTMKEVLTNKSLFETYKNHSYVGIDDATPRTMYLFDTEIELEKKMEELDSFYKPQAKNRDRDYWAARVRLYEHVNFKGRYISWNFRTTHDKRYTKSIPLWINDKISSMKVDNTTFSWEWDRTYQRKIWRAIYIKCYEGFQTDSRNTTDRIWHYEDNKDYPNLHDDGWGDNISLIRIGDGNLVY